jgi:hypothetical protein
LNYQQQLLHQQFVQQQQPFHSPHQPRYADTIHIY